MEYTFLIGKTITGAKQKKLIGYDDEGFMELSFSDGTKSIIVACYGDYTGKSEGEYQTGIYCTEDKEEETNVGDLEDVK